MDLPDSDAKHVDEVRVFYDSVYHKTSGAVGRSSTHLRKLARKIGIRPGHRVLDVACGCGEWLQACAQRGANICGVDISEKAVSVCKTALPQGEFHTTRAEHLPFEDNRFDVVTCLGALEHFISPGDALDEMTRVACQGATFLLLVPNSDFLTRRLGLYRGTHQAGVHEEVRTLSEWEYLFNASGLDVQKRWRDLHVLSWPWISAGNWYAIPIRAAQAAALCIWPLKWQYQVYHLCGPSHP